MVATGSPIDAKKAHQVGIIDHLIEGNLIEGAEAYVNRLISEGAGPRPAKDIPIDSNAVPEDLFKEFRKKIEKRTRGYFAPERCVQALEAAVDLPFEEGLKKESQLFMECITHPQAAALQHLFFAEREASKVPDVTRETPIREIKKIGVIGCGTMGSGISMACSNAGFPVTVVETDNRTLEKGLSNIKKSYESSVKKGRITADQAVERVSRIQGVLDFEELGNADLVIEAVYEDLKLKKEIFHRLDTICKQGTILATNTSTLDVDEISQCTNRPADVIGLHFFSPAHVMRLLEIVRGNQTAADVLATSTRLAKAIGKVGVVSGVCFGFIGNRMLFGYAREAHVLLLEGATPQQVDQAIYEFGFPMGPFTMMDLAGIDIGYRIRQEIGASPGEEQFSLISDRLAEMGRLGQKTGAGFYLYEPGSRKPLPDPEVQGLIEEEARLLGFKRRAMADSEIVKRCIYPLVNEGARILEEGIALRPGDIDVVWTTGYGFPPYRGGPMHYADSIGLAKIYEEICGFRNSCGEHWRPAPLLRALAEEERPFSDRR
jgi:3-hydroxyacyl-CoA dehydrogenase